MQILQILQDLQSNIISKAIDSLQIKPDDTILEIGPGNASHVNYLLTKAGSLRYYGIDISETMVAEAQRINSGLLNVFFKLSDGHTVPFEDNYFNKIFTVNTIYFWKNPDSYLQEINRVLKPGGKISIGFIPESTMQHIPFAKYGFTLYSIEKVTDIMGNNGFTDSTAITETELIKSNSGEDIEREFVIFTALKK
mgnify:FL=1